MGIVFYGIKFVIVTLIINIFQVLDTVIRNTDSITTSSVTRRSGGYPIIVQCVLSAENQSKQVNQYVIYITESNFTQRSNASCSVIALL